MAENQHGFNRRSSSVTRTYPGAATRVSNGVPSGGGTSSRSSASPGSVPAVFVRPLSRSQLAPVHGASPSSLMTESSRRQTLHGSSRPPISLDQPRPDSERHRNLYLGAPVSHTSSGSSGGGRSNSPTINCSSSSDNAKNYVDSSSVTAAEQVRLPTNARATKKGHSDTDSQINNVVTLQPTKRTLLEPERVEDSGKVKLAESSITCPYCRKCRCEACATPRPLPSRWICSKSIHCGPEPFLDYVTCLCCVKAVFYHCGKDHEPDGGVMCADKPCSCAPHRKFWRWGCMAAMSVIFPCLCLYWPCRGCIRLAEKTYQQYHNNACTCNHNQRSLPTLGVNMRRDAAGMDQSEDEDRGFNVFSHPPTVIPKTGTDKLLPSSK